MLQRSILQAVSQIVTNPILVGVAVMLCVALLAYRTFGLLSTPPDPPSVNVDNPNISSGPANSLNVSELAALNLFGDAKSNPTVQEQPVQDDLPETRLKLILQGAFTSSEDQVSSALIATDRRDKAQRYYVGDEVPGNAVLHQVYTSYVVLKRGGRLEKLLFPRAQGSAETQPGYAGTPRQRPKAPHPVNRTNGNNLKDRLRELRKQLNENDENIRI